MLKVLIKKQLTEVFRNYFFDQRRNRMRSKAAIAAWFIFFAVMMVGVMGGMFTTLALSLCPPLVDVEMDWLYFVLLSGTAVLFGAFGSVFSTYSGLYLAKDNDLLLSMPIPVRTIMASRLLNVYLLGTLYSLTALLPMVIVYWVTAGLTAARLICGVLLMLIVTVLVLLLSCVLGWAVAKISLKLRNKSFVTVLASLLFIAAYYFFYFKAGGLIRDLITNAAVYGEQIKDAAHGLYLFGRMGEGDWLSAAVCCGVTALLAALIWLVMSRSFLRIATSSASVKKVRYAEKPARRRSVFGALLIKELGRFTSSANYMLNCGLGILMIPAVGVLLLVRGRWLFGMLGAVLGIWPGAEAVVLCAAICLLSSMNDLAAPSVSLEGKSIWIPQSLPIPPARVLRAKMTAQLLLAVIPVLFTAVCAAVIVRGTVAVKLLVCLLPVAFSVFNAMLCSVVGVRMPMLNWTNEIAPIKQSGPVLIAIFGCLGICSAVAGLYVLAGYRIGAVPYLAIWTALFAVAAAAMLRWLDTRGAKLFARL